MSSLWGGNSMNHYVYEITNLINGKKYIGKRSCECPIEEDKYMGSGIAIARSIKKYGKDNFIKEIIEVCSSEKDAFEKERFWISYYNAVDSEKYYNIKDGGEGNTREDVLRYMANLTPEQLKERSRKLSIANKGKNNSMYGKKGKDNPVSKAVVMISLNGKLEKEFECLREVNDYFGKDRCFSYVSRICIEKKGGAYGYMWLSKEDYEEMLLNNTFIKWVEENSKYVKRYINAYDYCKNQEVYQLEIKTLKILAKYESIQKAKDITGIRTAAIIRNCKHGSNTAGGYSWILAEEYNKLSMQEIRQLYSHKISEGIHKPRPQCQRKVICITTNKVFNSISEAGKFYGMGKSNHISDVCKGKRKTLGKTSDGTPLKWMYYEDYLKLNNKKEIVK